MNNHLPEENDHPSAQSLAAWLNRATPAEEADHILEHLIHCAAGREQMLMIRQASQPEAISADEPEFDRLLRLGEQAAEEVWLRQQTVAQPVAQTADKPRWQEWFTFRRPALRWATAVVLLLAVAIPVYRFYQSQQPVESAMASLRQAWDRNRPIETRVTGDFPYLPYLVTRGPGEAVSVNQAQLLAATAELAREVADRPTPRARHALGRLHLLKEEFDEAEKLLKEVVDEEPRNAQAYVDLASVYYERGVKSESPQLFFEAARHLQTATEISPKLAEAWFNLALCHEKMLLFTQAKADWEQYLKLDADSQWASEARDRWQKLRERAVLREPQPDKVAEELRAAVAEKNETTLRRLFDEHYTEVTDLIAGRFMDEYLTAAIARNQPEAAQRHQLLKHLAEMIRDSKEDHYFVDLLRFVESSPPARLEKIRAIREQLQQGKAQYQAGQYGEAIKFAIVAKNLAESIADVCHTEAALYDLARIETPQTETREMPHIRQRLLSEAERRRHRQMQARALLALTNQYGTARQLSHCLEASLRALEIASQIGDTDVKVAALRTVGVAYSYLGDQEQSVNAHYAATQILYFRSMSLLRACQTHVQFARSLADYGQYYEAQHYQREALQFCQRSNPTLYLPALGRAGKYAALAGNTEESLHLFQQALTEAEHIGQILSTPILLVDLYLSLGDSLVRNQRFSEAESAYEKAKEKLGQMKHLRYLSAIQHGLATAFLPQGKIQEAEAALNKSFELTELSRSNVSAVAGRSTFVSSQLNVYQSMVGFQYFYKNSPERAFGFSEIYRNRELLDLMAQARAVRWEEKGKDLKLAASSEPLTLSQIQAKLPAGTRLVEYAITEQHLLIWVIDRDRFSTESVAVTPAQLKAMVFEYLQVVRERHNLAALNTQAKKLYHLLIQPVANRLRLQDNLVIIPDGLLNSLPFAALVNPETQCYLLEEYTLTINPSASILVELLDRSRNYRRRPIKSALVVNNPEFDRRLFPKLSRLSSTGEEIRGLTSLYGLYDELPGAQATKERFRQKAPKFDVLHLAAHSLVNAREPLLSAIVLAAEKREPSSAQTESLLAAHEIFRMRLPQTRLVILSSCNSLINQMSGHSGLGGLAHAFFSAGVPTVVGSLWEVEDESTAGLMAAFHRNWRTAKLSAAQALRKAQLDFLRSDKESQRHPSSWAAFQVSGDGITI